MAHRAPSTGWTAIPICERLCRCRQAGGLEGSRKQGGAEAPRPRRSEQSSGQRGGAGPEQAERTTDGDATFFEGGGETAEGVQDPPQVGPGRGRPLLGTRSNGAKSIQHPFGPSLNSRDRQLRGPPPHVDLVELEATDRLRCRAATHIPTHNLLHDRRHRPHRGEQEGRKPGDPPVGRALVARDGERLQRPSEVVTDSDPLSEPPALRASGAAFDPASRSCKSSAEQVLPVPLDDRRIFRQRGGGRCRLVFDTCMLRRPPEGARPGLAPSLHGLRTWTGSGRSRPTSMARNSWRPQGRLRMMPCPAGRRPAAAGARPAARPGHRGPHRAGGGPGRRPRAGAAGPGAGPSRRASGRDAGGPGGDSPGHGDHPPLSPTTPLRQGRRPRGFRGWWGDWPAGWGE